MCAVAAEVMAHVTRREPFLTIDGLRMSKNRMFFSSAKAERDLGYKARPYPEALRGPWRGFATMGNCDDAQFAAQTFEDAPGPRISPSPPCSSQ